jgi:hypothetical protein
MSEGREGREDSQNKDHPALFPEPEMIKLLKNSKKIGEMAFRKF